MPDPLPQSRSRVTTAPQTITRDVDELEAMMERAADRAALKAAQAVKLKHDNGQGLQESKSLMMKDRDLMIWRRLAYGLGSLSIAVAATMTTCLTAYRDARDDAVEPAASAKATAERADTKVETVAVQLDERLDAADARVTKIETTLATVTAALDANTRAVLGIAAKLDGEKAKGTKGR